MKTNEKSYINKLKNLFDIGNIEDIKSYILSITEDNDEYDIFIQKIQEFAKNDELEIVEEMIYDDDIIQYTKPIFENEQDYEQFLYCDNEYKDELMDQIPEDKIDEKDVWDDSIELIETIAEKFGISDASK
jgi:hypothetical protein